MGVNGNEIKWRKILIMPSIILVLSKILPSITNTKAFPSLSCVQRRTISWNKKSHIKHVPDDVIINIFSRLPLECVARCRIVCKKWLALFSSQHFARMHLKTRRDTPVILLQKTYLFARFHQSSVVTFNGGNMKKSKTGPTTSLMKLIGTEAAMLYGSCDGLLVFRRGLMDHLVCNPTTREQFTIKQPVTSLTRIFCGILFQPRIQEHILVFSEEIDDSPPLYEYSVFTISTKSWKRVSSFAYKPLDGHNAIVINSRLHWMAAVTYHDRDTTAITPPCTNSIISCNMEIEDFRSMPHPGKECFGNRLTNHMTIRLLEMKEQGVLCFSDNDCKNFIVRLWVLEDYDNWGWVLNYNIDISPVVRKYRYYWPKVRVVKVEGDELMFTWNGEELFSHNLVDYTMRKLVHLPRIAEDDVRRQEYQSNGVHWSMQQQLHHFTMVSYTKSFISLSPAS